MDTSSLASATVATADLGADFADRRRPIFTRPTISPAIDEER
ncbi:hypothetical protein [Mycobacterium sp. SA01]